MAFIKGKIEAEIEIVSRRLVCGESKFEMCTCGCGKWFDKITGEEAIVTTFEEAFKEAEKPLCEKK